MDGLLRADFHMHTKYSMDSSSSLEDIIARCQETGINCIAITDHNAIEGALKMKEIAPFTVIPGEEILTPNGEIIGYFLKEWIPSNQPIEKVIDAIKAQGGLVGVPHPFDTFRGLKDMDNGSMDKLASQVDVFEIFNARSLLPWDSDKARDFAHKHHLPATAGSDAHSPREIGKTYVEMQPFQNKDEFLASLRKARIQRRRSSPFVHAYTVMAKIARAF
jgi:predicted metal-dependent phosphoesterase TrpH